MKKLTFLVALLALTCTSVFAQVTKQQNIAEWTRAKAYTKAYLDAMPAGGYMFKATPAVRSYAEQFLHIADAANFFGTSASGKSSPLGKASAEKTIPQTKEAVSKAVLESYDYMIAILQNTPDAELQQIVDIAGQKITKALVIAKAFEHQTHHRGQATIYLRLKGVTPPAEMLF
jgi:uncharacterized damage-inducible protein DinB